MCRIPASAEISWCSFWSRSMMLSSLHTKNTRLISRWIIFYVGLLRPISSRYFNVSYVTDTFCQICGICGITVTDLEPRLEVIQGCWFGTNRKRAYDTPYVCTMLLPSILEFLNWQESTHQGQTVNRRGRGHLTQQPKPGRRGSNSPIWTQWLTSASRQVLLLGLTFKAGRVALPGLRIVCCVEKDAHVSHS